MRATIPGFPNYEIDDQGEVYSRGRTLVRIPNSKGYLRVFLRLSGKTHSRYVHRLVCETFRGPAPTGTECAHLNGVRSDCRLANLIWATKAENEGHKVEHGTRLCGEAVSGAVLSEAILMQARERARAKEPMKDIALDLGVAERTLADAITGRRWASIGHAVPAFHTRRRLTDEEVAEARARCAAGERQADVGRRFGVGRTAIGQIVRRESYQHLP
ncbi:HNH endonuclease [Methylorubrum salsuginis]|uniref:HNH endonuclease n=1 Tax=Methylorubrum salsuginis TaxID=414703 RepID=A0A1I4FKT6_9HYPH|nr:HNH endonuclease [Methylorubrum salsuginis]SFL17466.1 HNH endonuclease [Methylorubrum salsuginis]